MIERLAKQSRPPKRERVISGKKSYVIVCPRCVELEREITTHKVGLPTAKACPEHQHYMRVKRYRANNPVKNTNRRRNYLHQNREKMKAYLRDYYIRTRERQLDAARKRYEVKRDQVRAKNAAYYEANKDRINARDRARRRARHFDFDVSIIPAEVLA